MPTLQKSTVLLYPFPSRISGANQLIFSLNGEGTPFFRVITNITWCPTLGHHQLIGHIESPKPEIGYFDDRIRFLCCIQKIFGLDSEIALISWGKVENEDYLQISMDNSHGVTISKSIDNGPNCFGRFTLSEMIFFDNTIKKLAEKLNSKTAGHSITEPLLPSYILKPCKIDWHLHRSRTTWQHLDDPPKVLEGIWEKRGLDSCVLEIRFRLPFVELPSLLLSIAFWPQKKVHGQGQRHFVILIDNLDSKDLIWTFINRFPDFPEGSPMMAVRMKSLTSKLILSQTFLDLVVILYVLAFENRIHNPEAKKKNDSEIWSY